jgi:hypothetical protein
MNLFYVQVGATILLWLDGIAIGFILGRLKWRKKDENTIK